LDVAALGLESVHAQVQRAGLLQVLGQGPEVLAQLVLQGFGHPLGQIVAVRGHQGICGNGVTGGQPLLFGVVQGCGQKVAGAEETQNGQLALFGAGARAGQLLEQQLFAQHRKCGFGQGRTLARAQRAVFTEIARHHSVGGMFKLENQPDQIGAGV